MMVGGKDGTSRHARQTEEFAGAISMAQHTPELRLGVRCVLLQLFEHNEKAYRSAVQMMEECGKAAIVHGSSLKAVGYTCEGKAGGLEWNGTKAPKQADQYPRQMKTRWVKKKEGLHGS